MNRFYFPALILVLAVIVGGILISAGKLVYFVDFPSLIIATVLPLLLCFTTFTPADMGRSFRAAFGRGRTEKKELEVAVVFFLALQRYLLLSACIGALIGIMSMLSQTQDLKAIGMGFAMLLICVFYAVVLIMVLAMPFRVSAERKLAELAGASR
jgi:flagellar motor component MotA